MELSGGAPSGTITATIPLGTPNGTGYRVRVVSSTPQIVGNNNGSNLNINSNVNAVCKNFTATYQPSGINITTNDINNGSTATCGIANLSLSQTNFTAVGTYTVTLTVEDNNGNIATCNATVTITKANQTSPSPP
ncbi:MAG: hypothetical protein HC913_16115 [Microscillaceae bacterium]|nr:hypothetical protein [Microscillaceae bacterium]